MAITHDVDRIRKTYQHLTHLRNRSGWWHLKSLFSGDNPYWNFDRIMELEASFGARSTFYFLQEGHRLASLSRRELAVSLGKYRFGDEPVASIIETLDRGGWEVGLHGSYDSYRSAALLSSEKAELEDVLGHEVEGVRQHFLNLEIPRTWEIQRHAGFRYDSSLGHRDRVGFDGLPRYPVSPFHDGFLVLPLAIMDGALFASHPSETRARERIAKIMAEASNEHALLVVLWHQRFLNPSEFPLQYNVYRFLLSQATRMNAWLATARRAATWWREEGLHRL